MLEAQKIGSKYKFFSVGGSMSHLLGYVHEAPGVKYQVEIKYDDTFPANPPQLIYSRPIINVLGPNVQLDALDNWAPESEVVAIIEELKQKVLQALAQPPKTAAPAPPKEPAEKPVPQKSTAKPAQGTPEAPQPAPPQAQEEQWVTPDFGAYPDAEAQQFLSPESFEGGEGKTGEDVPTSESPGDSVPAEGEAPVDTYYEPPAEEGGVLESANEEGESFQLPEGGEVPPAEEEPPIVYDEDETPAAAVQMAILQQEYSADAFGPGRAQVYMTITIEQTFILKIEFNNYPGRPNVILPSSIKAYLGDVNQTIKALRDWSEKKSVKVVDVIREIEKKLYSLKDVETQAKEIMGEYRVEKISGSIANLRVHLLTFGFKEYLVDFDLTAHPNVPEIKLSSELFDLLKIGPEALESVNNWKGKDNHVVEVVRELSWLVDKNSRLKFEIELLTHSLKDVAYNSETQEIRIKMKGEMKTKDTQFEFKAIVPPDYPSSAPKVDLVSALEGQETVKEGVEKSIKDFFSSWNTFSFLVDLFNTISKAIFNVSTLTCILCHKIECPGCSQKIAAPEGEESCHSRCPHCERDYHKHCWEQTISAFGKCGFCLRAP